MQLYFSGVIDTTSYWYSSYSAGGQPAPFFPPTMYDLQQAIPSGSQFQGSFSYDPATPASWTYNFTNYPPPWSGAGSEGVDGSYAYYDTGEFSAQVGEIGLWAPKTTTSVANDHAEWLCCSQAQPGLVEIRQDWFTTSATTDLVTTGTPHQAQNQGVQLHIWQKYSLDEWWNSGSAFDSAALPETAPLLDNFWGWLTLSFGKYEYDPYGGNTSEVFHANGHMTYLGITPQHAEVPEPGSFALMGLGLALLMLICRAAKTK